MKNKTIWISSDFHYGHYNIVFGKSEWTDKSRCRPFQTVDEMNYILIESINNTVKENDILYCLGDWSLGGKHNVEIFRKQLHVKEINLITGNHNAYIKKNISYYEHFFNILPDIFNININKQFIVMCHFPIASWERLSQGSLMLHGHLHSQPGFTLGPGRMMDVGIDGSENFRPYNLHEEIIPLLKDRPLRSFLSHDIHER